jgi:hypothetical protein
MCDLTGGNRFTARIDAVYEVSEMVRAGGKTDVVRPERVLEQFRGLCLDTAAVDEDRALRTLKQDPLIKLV